MGGAAPTLSSERGEPPPLLRRREVGTQLKLQFTQLQATVLPANEHLLTAHFVLFYLSLKNVIQVKLS